MRGGFIRGGFGICNSLGLVSSLAFIISIMVCCVFCLLLGVVSWGVILVFTGFKFLFFLGCLVLGWFGWLTFLVTFGVFSCWGGVGFLYLRTVNAFFSGGPVSLSGGSLFGGSGCILRGNLRVQRLVSLSGVTIFRGSGCILRGNFSSLSSLNLWNFSSLFFSGGPVSLSGGSLLGGSGCILRGNFRGQLLVSLSGGSLLRGSGCILRGNFSSFSSLKLWSFSLSLSPIFTSGHFAPLTPYFSLFGGSPLMGSLFTSGRLLGQVSGGVLLHLGIFGILGSGSPPLC